MAKVTIKSKDRMMLVGFILGATGTNLDPTLKIDNPAKAPDVNGDFTTVMETDTEMFDQVWTLYEDSIAVEAVKG